MEIKEIEAKSILVPSKLPDVDYVINSYTGCAFGCTYCYASFMGRYVGKQNDDWGDFVYVKTNAPILLENEIKKLKNKGKGKSVFFSSVTDSYQGMEAKYEITRKCLRVLADCGFEGTISILTKSHMVLRDVDIFKRLKNVEVGFTVTSVNDSISRYFEKKAPNVSQRFEAMKELNKQGIKTYAFVGPLLPHFVSQSSVLDELFANIAKTGTREIYVEHINLSKYILDRLKKEMPDLDKEILSKFYESRNKKYREDLEKIVLDLVGKYNLKLRLGSAIYHKDL